MRGRDGHGEENSELQSRRCEDINRVQSKATYDFVFVDDEGFEKYHPKTFKSLMDGFTLYKSNDEHG